PSVRFQADGKLVAQDHWTNRLNIWDLGQKKIVTTAVRREHPSVGRTPTSTDALGNLFAYHHEKGIAVRDLVADREICRLPLTTDNQYGAYPSISSDGKKTLVCEHAKDAMVVRWYDTQIGQELGQYLIPNDKAFPHVIWPVEWYASDGSKFGYA